MFRKIRNLFKTKLPEYEARLSFEALTQIKDEEIELENIKDGIESAEKRLLDFLSVKKSMEDKAVNIFKSQIGLASISIILAIINTKLVDISGFSLVCVSISILIFVIGAVFSLLSLQVGEYGSLGGNPINWLQNSIITKKDSLKKLLLLSLDDYLERIDTSEISNKEKARFLQCSIWLLIIAIIPLIVGVFNLLVVK
jgi:hypothetical protein